MSVPVPLYGVDEVVEVPLDELPPCSDILDLLRGEAATLDHWLTLAQAYYINDDVPAFTQLLNEAMEIPEDVFPESKHERVGLIAALANHHVTRAAQVSTVSRRHELDLATQLLSKGETVDVGDSRLWIGRGFIYLLRGDLDKARAQFDLALRQQPVRPIAMLGKACCSYLHGNYPDALRLFKQLMCVCREPPAGVRLGLGLCYAKLKQPALATECFERTLELDPQNFTAALALAVAETEAIDDPETVRKGVQRLEGLHRRDPTNPNVLSHLANHFFYRKDFATVENVSQVSVESAAKHINATRLKAESRYHQARVLHAQGDWARARQHYAEAVNLVPNLAPAQFGLAQVLMREGNMRASADALRKVAKAVPDAPLAHRCLGFVCAALGGHDDEAERSLRQATALAADDGDTWIVLGSVLALASVRGGLEEPVAESKARAALEAYESGVSASRSQGRPTPLPVWNNIGVLHARLGALEEAEVALRRALHLGAGEEGSGLTLAQVTVAYNLGHLHETARDYEKAEARYLEVATAFPGYADAIVGMAACALARGRRADAEGRLRQAMHIRPDHAVAKSLLGRLHASGHNWHRARQAFESVLVADATKRDSYAMLSIADIHVATSSVEDFEQAEERKKLSKLDRALDMYRSVLAKDHTNVYAAHGVGVVLAERGYLHEVRSAGAGHSRPAAGRAPVAGDAVVMPELTGPGVLP